MRHDVLILSVVVGSLLLLIWPSWHVWNAACPSSATQPKASAAPPDLHIFPLTKAFTLSWFDWNGIRVPASKEIDHRKAQDPEYEGADASRSRPIESTKVVVHASGNTVFERLYIFDGAIHIVTDDLDSVPYPERITSNGDSLSEMTEPTEEDIRGIPVAEAERMFGGRAVPLDGTTFMITEHRQFINHYYHFTAEILLSLYRTYSALNSTLPPPSRLIFPHCDTLDFRDGPGMNAYVSRAAFPSASLLFAEDWADLHQTWRAFVLERVVLFDRAAAMGGPAHTLSSKPISEALSLPTSAEDFWAPVREQVVDFAGGDEEMRGVPVVTYVSRQGSNRRTLRHEDHVELVAALQEASEELGYEFQLVQLEEMSKAEQIRLAARTTVMMGVHGNGLTSLAWMRPSAHSAVFEFFMPQGWFRDYEITATALGIPYRGFWNDTAFAYPGFNNRDTEGFHSTEIPIHAPTVIVELALALARGAALDSSQE